MLLRLLLLLAVATSAAPHVIWTEFSPNRKASGVRHATGYPIEVLEYTWDKCGSALISQGRGCTATCFTSRSA